MAVFNLKEGWTRVVNRRTGVGFGLTWDLEQFPHSLIWRVAHGDSGYPRYGGTHVLGFVPRNDRVRGLAESARMGGCPEIGPDEVRTFWITATALRF